MVGATSRLPFTSRPPVIHDPEQLDAAVELQVMVTPCPLEIVPGEPETLTVGTVVLGAGAP